jgi:hypothetical protein
VGNGNDSSPIESSRSKLETALKKIPATSPNDLDARLADVKVRKGVPDVQIRRGRKLIDRFVSKGCAGGNGEGSGIVDCFFLNFCIRKPVRQTFFFAPPRLSAGLLRVLDRLVIRVSYCSGKMTT